MATDPQPGEKGAPLGNFKLSVDERLRAYTQGVPSHIRRRRRIEELEERLVALAAAEAPSERTAAELAEELAKLNDLIGRHNRYYPIEADLPVDVRTGRLLERGALWRPLAALALADLRTRAARLSAAPGR